MSTKNCAVFLRWVSRGRQRDGTLAGLRVFSVTFELILSSALSRRVPHRACRKLSRFEKGQDFDFGACL